MADPFRSLQRLMGMAEKIADEVALAQALKAGTLSVVDEDGNTIKISLTGTKVWGDTKTGWVPPPEATTK